MNEIFRMKSEKLKKKRHIRSKTDWKPRNCCVIYAVDGIKSKRVTKNEARHRAEGQRYLEKSKWTVVDFINSKEEKHKDKILVHICMAGGSRQHWTSSCLLACVVALWSTRGSAYCFMYFAGPIETCSALLAVRTIDQILRCSVAIGACSLCLRGVLRTKKQL